jgi:hypothetical protein
MMIVIGLGIVGGSRSPSIPATYWTGTLLALWSTGTRNSQVSNEGSVGVANLGAQAVGSI